MGGKEGSWCHQMMALRVRRRNQKNRKARGHLIGHRWGMKTYLKSNLGLTSLCYSLTNVLAGRF